MQADGVPQSLIFEEREVSCWTYEQLSRVSRPNLKQRALNLRDLVGAERLALLRAGGGRDQLICWLLASQVAIANSLGLELTVASFGAPADLWREGEDTMFGPRSGPADGLDAPPPPTPELRPAAPRDRHDDASSIDSRPTTAHEEAEAAAKANRARNQGSLCFGADFSAPYSSGFNPTFYGKREEESRPSTACSIASLSSNISHQQAHEDACLASERNRTLNQVPCSALHCLTSPCLALPCPQIDLTSPYPHPPLTLTLTSPHLRGPSASAKLCFGGAA